MTGELILRILRDQSMLTARGATVVIGFHRKHSLGFGINSQIQKSLACFLATGIKSEYAKSALSLQRLDQIFHLRSVENLANLRTKRSGKTPIRPAGLIDHMYAAQHTFLHAHFHYSTFHPLGGQIY